MTDANFSPIGGSFEEDVVLKALVAILEDEGVSISGDSEVLEGLLCDYAGGYNCGVFVLSAATKLKIPFRITEGNLPVWQDGQRERFISYLCKRFSISYSGAEWAIDTWHSALVLTTTSKERVHKVPLLQDLQHSIAATSLNAKNWFSWVYRVARSFFLLCRMRAMRLQRKKSLARFAAEFRVTASNFVVQVPAMITITIMVAFFGTIIFSAVLTLLWAIIFIVGILVTVTLGQTSSFSDWMWLLLSNDLKTYFVTTCKSGIRLSVVCGFFCWLIEMARSTKFPDGENSRIINRRLSAFAILALTGSILHLSDFAVSGLLATLVLIELNASRKCNWGYKSDSNGSEYTNG